jgi:hypothetical protein
MTWKDKRKNRGRTYRGQRFGLDGPLVGIKMSMSKDGTVCGDIGDSSRGSLIEDANSKDALEITY